jgi:hypothetical protein
MPYSPWTKIDSGREGLWKNKVWLGALKIISKHEGESVYGSDSPVYTELEEELPGVGWMKEQNGEPRPLFRDYAKPWTATGVLDLTDQKFRLTNTGRKLISGELSPCDFFQGFINRWIEDGERPFTQLASAFLEFKSPLGLRDLYFGVMLGYRKGDDIKKSIALARTQTSQMEDTPRRRLLMLLSIMEATGAIAREDFKTGDTDAKWIIWDTALIKEVASIGDAVTQQSEGTASAKLDDVVNAYHDSITNGGLTIDLILIRRFICALTAKRFGVLTGLSGSGKTKLAEAFAMWLCESPKQYQVVAVGADWTSNENLLGYADALQAGVYRMPANGALDLMLRAAADPEKPYFLILDEMNLSHVERYFADVLSAIESGNAHIALHGHAGLLPCEKDGAARVPATIPLPANLFIIGTVNVDETTYMFSPKVLDRANVIEFRATASQMGTFLDDPAHVALEVLKGQGAAYAGAFVQRAIAPAPLDTLVDADGGKVADKLKAALLDAFAALSDIGAEFGFRSANEIARFVAIHKELSGKDWKFSDALDAQVLQKLMPKLHGSARKLEGVLKALDAFAETHGLPLTREKIARMQKRLERDGFTSFAEN